jgi:hypothetical protein
MCGSATKSVLFTPSCQPKVFMTLFKKKKKANEDSTYNM